MTPLEAAPSVAELNTVQLALQYNAEEVARAAGRLENSRVDTLGLLLDQNRSSIRRAQAA